ncbi:MAG: peptidoglycan recognition family protein [Syntrophomonadaceae bacterium]
MQIVETNFRFKGSLTRRKSTKRVILHHSASPDVPASTIHGWHLNQKWSGIGYHFVIRANGAIERGRPEWAIGSHSGPDGNGDSIGIVLTGNFEYDKPTEGQLDSLVWLITQYLEPKYGKLQVIGHKDVMATACPGKNFPWAELRQRLEDDEMIYKTLNDVPDWGKPLVKKLMDRKSLVGDGKGDINLPESTLKTLAILEREGVLK